MKKVFLFLASSALAFSAISCTSNDGDSNDDKGADNTAKSTVKCTVDGVERTFSTVAASIQGGEVSVVAYNGTPGDPTESVVFSVQRDFVGTADDEGFSYYITEKHWVDDDGDFTLNVVENKASAGTLKGTFSGTLEDFTSDKPAKNITNGTFDIKYE